MYELLLDKRKWLRGEEAAASPYLLHPSNGKFDALGRIFLLAGYGKDTIVGKRFPSDVAKKHQRRHDTLAGPCAWLTNSAKADTEDAIEIIRLNDDATINDVQRVAAMTPILAANGIKLTVADSVSEADSRYDRLSPYVWLDNEKNVYVMPETMREVGSVDWVRDYGWGNLAGMRLRDINIIADEWRDELARRERRERDRLARAEQEREAAADLLRTLRFYGSNITVSTEASGNDGWSVMFEPAQTRMEVSDGDEVPTRSEDSERD